MNEYECTMMNKRAKLVLLRSKKEARTLGHTWDGATLSINRSSGAPRDAQGRSVALNDAQVCPGTPRDAQGRPWTLRAAQRCSRTPRDTRERPGTLRDA